MLKVYTNGSTSGVEYSPFWEFFCDAAQIEWLPKVPKSIVQPNCTRCAFSVFLLQFLLLQSCKLKDRKD